MAESNSEGDDNAKLTCAGCILTLLSVAVIVGVAIPIVQWRSAMTGESLPRDVAIAAPFVFGAAFYAIGTGLLRLVGLRIWSKSETDESRSPEG